MSAQAGPGQVIVSVVAAPISSESAPKPSLLLPSPSPPLVPVSRVITKESLNAVAASTTSSPAPVPHESGDDSSLFEFNLLLDSEDHHHQGELLSLPLTSIDLPLTPPPLEVQGADSFDSAAASLLTPAEVSVATEPGIGSSSLLSTAAALAAAQGRTATAAAPVRKVSVSVAAPPVPSPQRRRANSKSGAAKKPRKKALKPKAASPQVQNRLVVSPLLPPPSVQHPPSMSEQQPPQGSAPQGPAPVANPVAAAPPATTAAPPVAPQAAPGTTQVVVKKYAPQPTAAQYTAPRPSVAPTAHAPPPAPAARGRARSASGAAAGAGPAVENTGRWTAEEHRLFLQGLEQHGKGWKKIATLIKSRTVVQIRTHAQKYFQKLAKARQNGEAAAGVGMGTVGGTVVTGVPSLALEGGEQGIPVPLDANGRPVVTMRTTAHPTQAVTPGQLANMSLGNDPTSLAAAAGTVNINGGARRGGRRTPTTKAAGTKRRAIGNVVRSAVREGRNVKRQKGAEAKRKARANSTASAPVPGTAPVPQATNEPVKEEYGVPNPLPSVSSVLDPYVAVTTGMPPPPSAPTTAPGAPNAQGAKKKGGRGRQQLVHTATHGTLPRAALEDAIHRLLTPAAGAPAPGQAPPPHPAPANAAGIVDPLAPNPIRVPLTHNQYHPSPPVSAAGAAAPGTAAGVANPSPTGVAEMALLPSWVDAKNPPQWYNDGSDIDTLLEDAECLNWLSDTGDLGETYPPALSEPAAVVSSQSTATTAVAGVEPTPLAVQDPTGGVVHPSHESLSFLVDHPEPTTVAAAAAPAPVEDVHALPPFLDEGAALPEPSLPPPPAPAAYASATEAVAAVHHQPPEEEAEPKLADVSESHGDLMGFPDLDMGDEQAFVSALLDNSEGRGSQGSFPKFHSELHMSKEEPSE